MCLVSSLLLMLLDGRLGVGFTCKSCQLDGRKNNLKLSINCYIRGDSTGLTLCVLCRMEVGVFTLFFEKNSNHDFEIDIWTMYNKIVLQLARKNIALTCKELLIKSVV